MSDQIEIAAWSAYWRSGQDGSCFEGGQSDIQLAEIWDAFVSQFQDGARLIDLAAGNGIAARWCAQAARTRNLNLEIEAVDAAELNPKPAPGVGFRSGVRLESLPHPDASFTGAFSQFGFEYADEAQAASEVVRILAPKGRLRFVIHAHDGDVARDIQQRVHRLEEVLADDGPVGLALTLARAHEASDTKTLSEKERLVGAAAAHLQRLYLNAPRDDAAVFYSQAVLSDWARRDRYDPSDLRRAFEGAMRNAKSVLTRQRQMLQVAQSRDDMVALSARLAALGLNSVAFRPLILQGGHVGWVLDAAKP